MWYDHSGYNWGINWIWWLDHTADLDLCHSVGHTGSKIKQGS